MTNQIICLKSLEKCQLAIGSYPYYDYDATNGGGATSFVHLKKNGCVFVEFNPKNFSIPPLSWRTTKIFNVPLPPGLKIKMVLEKLQGTIDRNNGNISLDFKAKFAFSIFSRIKFPDLIVKTALGDKKLTSKVFKVQGKPIQENGMTTLVGIAVVPRTNNISIIINLSLKFF